MLKRMNVDLVRMSIEPIPMNLLSPQLIKRPLKIVVHKDKQSCQPVKINHVENGHDSQSEPLQQL